MPTQAHYKNHLLPQPDTTRSCSWEQFRHTHVIIHIIVTVVIPEHRPISVTLT